MLGRIAIDLNHDSSYDRRVKTGIQLAIQHDAEVIGVYTHVLTAQEIALAPEAMAIVDMAIAQQMASTKQSFLQQTSEAGVRASWRAPRGQSLEALSLHSRLCDILIMSHTIDSASAKSVLPYRTDVIITSVGRPVLIVPHSDVLPALGKHILICWDSSRNAARALSDAAPFLDKASTLIALSVNLDKELLKTQDIMPDDLAAYCTSHHYPALTEVRSCRPQNEIGEAILTAANDYHCDMIVMGAYSHSPLQEWAFGGATKTLLQSMRVPVLFSH